jgi:hypothetical protein
VKNVSFLPPRAIIATTSGNQSSTSPLVTSDLGGTEVDGLMPIPINKEITVVNAGGNISVEAS